MDKDEPTVTMKLKDVVRAVMMLEDAINVFESTIGIFIKQKDSFDSEEANSAENIVASKRIETGIESMKAKLLCKKFFLKDFKERINDTGIDIDAEIEKYKESFTGE